MSNIGMPIETIKDGNKITKICVEDIDKMANKIKLAVNQSFENISSIIRETNKTYNGVNGKFIIGKGVSQPCLTDAFDEEIGNNIAFMKAKLNANIKKGRILERVCKELEKLQFKIFDEMEKIDGYIELDIMGIRKHNPDYLIDKFDEI